MTQPGEAVSLKYKEVVSETGGDHSLHPRQERASGSSRRKLNFLKIARLQKRWSRDEARAMAVSPDSLQGKTRLNGGSPVCGVAKERS